LSLTYSDITVFWHQAQFGLKSSPMPNVQRYRQIEVFFIMWR